MVDFSFDNSSYSVDGLVRSTATTANRSIFLRTDSAHGRPLDWAGNTPPPTVVARVPNVRLVMDRTAPLTPITTGNFINGVWNGTVTLHTITTNVFLRVVDGEGHAGSSTPFALVSLPALAIRREDGAVSLRFPSLSGISYVVEASVTPVGAWTAVSGSLIGDGGVLE